MLLVLRPCSACHASPTPEQSSRGQCWKREQAGMAQAGRGSQPAAHHACSDSSDPRSVVLRQIFAETTSVHWQRPLPGPGSTGAERVQPLACALRQGGADSRRHARLGLAGSEAGAEEPAAQPAACCAAQEAAWQPCGSAESGAPPWGDLPAELLGKVAASGRSASVALSFAGVCGCAALFHRS